MGQAIASNDHWSVYDNSTNLVEVEKLNLLMKGAELEKSLRESQIELVPQLTHYRKRIVEEDCTNCGNTSMIGIDSDGVESTLA